MEKEKETKTYLMRMKPLEPYTFGTDIGFRFKMEETAGKKKEKEIAGKVSYLIPSKEMPEQTTVLGILRYLILKEKDILCPDFRYSSKEQEKIRMHIGPESFRFSRPENEQNFGDICSISPVFLIDQNNHYYVKTPFNDASWADQKNRETFRPMRLVPEEQAVMTQWGKIRMPQEGEFAYKQWHASDYFNLQERKAVSSCIKENQQLFRSVMITGNRKAEQTPEEDGFFKREGKILHGDFSFAVFIEVKSDTFPDPVRTLCRMGQKQSLFQVTLEEKKDDLEERVRDAFSKETEEPWYYALSDIVLTEEVRYREFCIVEMKSVRNLETSYDQKSTYIKKMRKNRVQYNLIESGSVFYGEFPVAVSEETAPGGNSSGGDGATESGEERLRTLQDLISPNHKKIGYSHIVKIEANHK